MTQVVHSLSYIFIILQEEQGGESLQHHASETFPGTGAG